MKNYGLQESIQEVSAYILGESKIPYIYYNESGDWEQYLPKFERQRTNRDEETTACTVFATLSQIETFHKFLYGDEPNYSERFTYNLIPITPGYGTDPQKTHECVRHKGLVDEQYLKMTNTAAEYADTSDITGSLLAKGLNWVQNNDYKHEWVWTSANNRPGNWKELLKDALKTSPVAVSVTAWREENGYYVSDAGGNNHYCLLYRIDDDGSMWVFDTYEQSKKRLHPDHNIRRAKRIWLNKRTRSAMKMHIRVLQNLIKLFSMEPSFLDICIRALGTDASPHDNAPDDFGCSETVTSLMKQKYPATPVMLGTWTLWTYLEDAKNGWSRVTDYLPGTIVLSPTGTGRGTGHVGVVMEDGTIASNNSFGIMRGKFTKNYTQGTWDARYVKKQSMPVYLYRHI